MTFSIIIPVYNVAPYLRECLDSVLAQTYTNWEAICVDDGSTDGSLGILDEYAGKDLRFHVIHQDNSGVSAARNAALDCAHGDWLCFLDSDDVLEGNCLERIHQECKSNATLDVIQFGHYRFDESGHFPCSANNTREYLDISGRLSEKETDAITLIMWGNALRRSKCSDVRFSNYVCGEDRLYTFKCLLREDRILRIGERLYGYRKRPMSYTTHVKKTYRGWDGELAYRIEFLQTIMTADKSVNCDPKGWLIGYLKTEHVYGFMISGELTDGEKRVLWASWKKSLLFLARCKVFHPIWRFLFSVQLWCIGYSVMYRLCQTINLLLGPQSFVRRMYRRIRRHGEFAPTTVICE